MSVNVVTVRKARREDCGEIMRLIQELAEFETMPDGVKTTTESTLEHPPFENDKDIWVDLEENTDPDPPRCPYPYPQVSRLQLAPHEMGRTSDGLGIQVFTVLEKDGFDASNPAYLAYIAEDQSDGKAVGYSICYISYDGFRGRCFFIEDIMVTEAYRGKGIGKLLFQYLCKEALERDCEIIRFYVLDWNPAAKFYAKMGAIDATVSEGWHWHIIYKDGIERAARTII